MQSTLRSEALARVYGNLGTLYAKCGGVFGVAAFVDRCMDKWMADPTLNENQAVTTWHQKAQRCGFKFLVVQIVCNLTGGPQVYTGRPIDVAHKHLNISEDEWSVFMEIFNQVCGEFGLAPEVIDDLNALMISMEMDCVVYPGEHVPRDPGPARPAGSSLYARLGGVYPIALFVDRVVDALLDDERVGLPVDTQKRNEASLKYLFTELVCSVCGGPEVVTSRDHDETKLLVPKSAWRIFIATAEVAADHLPRATRGSLLQVLESSKNHIVDPSSAEPEPNSARLEVAAAVKDVRAAAAGRMLSKEAIAARHAAPGALVAARKRVLGDPRTLYGRGGGIFGLARLADALMDKWMSDPELNANAKVAKWHESQQKYGFKFLVTQIFGYLTGGPQRYTGQPMEVAHKHLGINLFQWEAFMQGVGKVFREFKIDPATQKDLSGIIASFKDQIVVRDGEAVPADPGLCRKPPSGSSLYAHAGGVYPLAHFVDLLVEKAVDPRGSVRIPFDPTFKRSPPGLKYLVTELVCSGAGGPEVVTSRGFDDAKLGVPVEDWSLFLEMAADTARVVWPLSGAVQRGVVAMLDDQKTELCIGLVAEDHAPADMSRHTLMQAGFGLFEVSAALDQCRGDGQQAMELLTSGWRPPAAVPQPPAQPSRPAVCPFSGAVAGAAGVGHACPASRASNSSGGPSSGSASGQQAGRLLGDSLQGELDSLLLEEPELICPITLTLLLDPVIASDGCVYERAAVAELTRMQGVSPVTRAALSGQVIVASEQRAKVSAFMRTRSEELLGFVARARKQGKAVMALTALDRVKDYLAALTAEAEPELTRRFVGLCEELGRVVPSLSSPHERISTILKEQVARAKAEGEAVLQERGAACGGEKSVVFCVDTSGSMRGPRIKKAEENLLRIFDQYIEDEDHMSVVTFSHLLETRFELQEVGAGKRSRLRMMTEAACCSAGGGTAFWDALASCVDSLKPSPSGNQQWIVALTDGQDQHSKHHTLSSAKAAIRSATGKPDLIVIGVQLDARIKPDMENLCEATERSIFIDASGDLASLDDAFQRVAEMICD